MSEDREEHTLMTGGIFPARKPWKVQKREEQGTVTPHSHVMLGASLEPLGDPSAEELHGPHKQIHTRTTSLSEDKDIHPAPTNTSCCRNAECCVARAGSQGLSPTLQTVILI